MFVKTVKFTRKKALIIVLGAAVALAVIVLLVSGGSKRGGGALRTNADMASYLSKLGWVVAQEPLEAKEVTIPATFDAVMTDYNTLQKQQGFDLSKYSGQQATIYTFQVTNYPVQGDVLATLYVIKGRVIAGDIHSTAIDGFMHGLK